MYDVGFRMYDLSSVAGEKDFVTFQQQTRVTVLSNIPRVSFDAFITENGEPKTVYGKRKTVIFTQWQII